MRVLGLDLGTTSVGHALIDLDPERDSGRVIAAGVRIFPETRDPQSHEPTNKNRRDKRMLRRQGRRRRQRRRDLATALTDAGLLPHHGAAAWDTLCRLDPYMLRRQALDEALPPYHVGRLLHHLGKRRQFKGREAAETDAADTTAAPKPRKADPKAQEETAAQAERETFRAAVRDSGLTVGAYLAGLPPAARRRGHHAHRDDIKEEVDRIWQAQARHDPDRYTDAARAAVDSALFFQRPVFWRRSSLGHCRLIEGAEPCPKGAWIAHQRRMLEALNNLGLAGGNDRPLDEEERAAILAALQPVARLSWPACRKIIGRIGVARGEAKGWEKRIKFNLEETGDKSLPGNPLEAKLVELVGAADWARFGQRDALRRALFDDLMRADFGDTADRKRVVILAPAQRQANRAALAGTLADRFGLTAAQAAALAALPVQSGWDAYSTAAIERLLPALQRGTRLGALLNGPEWEDWRNTTFPTRVAPTGELLDRLPTPRDKAEATRLAGLRNPTVVRVQNEMRKVVNNLIAVHGRPDLIRVELARTVGQSAGDRDKADSRNRTNRRERARAAVALQKRGIATPRRRDINKYLLWQETGERCPYSGDHVGFDDLFGPAPGYDIEHIRPRSRSLDDSLGNLTICRKDFNIRKGNRLPYEAFHGDTALWDAMVQRVTAMADGKTGGTASGTASGTATGPATGRMPRQKRDRFLEKTLDDGFAARQLTDTGWAARAAVASLKRLWPDLGPTAPVTVQAVSGRVTAHLRHLWGLNSVLSDGDRKSRDDHRHHAIDALVVACAHPGTTNLLSRYWQRKDDPAAVKPILVKPVLPPPWPSIRDDAVAMVDTITVSHRVQRKVSGPLHEETNLGDTGKNATKQGVRYRLYVTRKPVAALTPPALNADDEGIRDRVVKAILRDRLAAHDGDLKKAFADPVTFPTGRPIRRVRVTTKQQPTLMAKTRAGYAKTGDNHHMAIFQVGDESIDFKVVSRLEAARRLSRRQPLVDRHAVPAGRFLFSLCPGEAVHLPMGDHAGIWIVRGVKSNGQITLERHTDAVAATAWRPRPAKLHEDGARKISIDPIGRIRPARD